MCSFWAGYQSPVRFQTILQCTMACQHLDKDDAVSILHAQTPDIFARFQRKADPFWKTAFQPLSIIPKRVKDGKGGFMLGCFAVEDIPAGTVVCTAKGFWWPKCERPPTNRMLPINTFNPETLMVWGISPAATGAENLLYYINTSCPMSLVNDYREFADGPNASLVCSLICL
jgi:hypothetical protein